MFRSHVAAALFGLVSMAAAACSGTVDTEKGEQNILEGLRDQTGLEIDSVTCPRDIEQKNGVSFNCDVVAEGGTLTVRVTQVNDSGNVRWNVSRGLVVGARVEDLLEQSVHEQTGARVTVDCGRRNRVAVPGQTFACRVISSAGEPQFAVRIEDETGNVSWTLER